MTFDKLIITLVMVTVFLVYPEFAEAKRKSSNQGRKAASEYMKASAQYKKQNKKHMKSAKKAKPQKKIGRAHV